MCTECLITLPSNSISDGLYHKAEEIRAIDEAVEVNDAI